MNEKVQSYVRALREEAEALLKAAPHAEDIHWYGHFFEDVERYGEARRRLRAALTRYEREVGE